MNIKCLFDIDTAMHLAEFVIWGFLGTILQVSYLYSSQKAALQHYLQIGVDSP